MDKNAPIGIFDSGLGGLTVARAVMDVLPQENLLYVGDTLNTPYGNKPLSQVRQYALRIMDSLVERGVKMLVIACNTASAAVLPDARERYSEALDIPVVEVIRPAATHAIEVSRSGKIGVIGTQATIMSEVYQDALAVMPGVEVSAAACPQFVDFVESGQTTGPLVREACAKYLQPLKQAQVDTVVLGCTHYPLLAGAISYEMGPQVALVSSADPTAHLVYRHLVRRELLNDDPAPASISIEATDENKTFMELAQRIIGRDRLLNGLDDRHAI
ncbi:MAG: glutamate racemase [Actinomycetaceae bacterium]|nr:glutamate racemase [Actinomycetaceae bacterium]